MKKLYFIFILAVCGISTYAQNIIPNGDFEQWLTIQDEHPTGFVTSNPQCYFKSHTPMNCVKSTDAYHGSFALELTTYLGTDTAFGYALSADPNGGNPCQWTGGMPYTQVPTGISGYYKNNSMPGDSAGLLVAFKNNGACMGVAMMKFGGSHSSYTPFFIPVSLLGPPDSIIFAAISSDVFSNVAIPGSTVKFDSISFTGGVAQPAMFDGDFENWTTTNIDVPQSWMLRTNDRGAGIFQTTDVNSGTYAMEMVTFQDSRNNSGTPSAFNAGVSTGNWDSNCSCLKGGTPFTGPIDTLAFYYKYAPMGNDSAALNTWLKNNGSFTGTGGGITLEARASYQYMEFPINTFGPADSIIVEFISSLYSDTLLSYIGSDLKLDNVHFKSQTTGIKKNYSNPVTISPNPSADGVFMLNNVNRYDLVRVFNLYGQEVNATIKAGDNSTRVEIKDKGAYFIYLNSESKVSNYKVIVTKE
jgi:hypothetical protein